MNGGIYLYQAELCIRSLRVPISIHQYVRHPCIRLDMSPFDCGKAVLSCMASFDLCHQISSFLDLLDLRALEAVNRSWIRPVSLSYQRLRDSASYKHLSYKLSSKCHTDKRICSRIFNNRKLGAGLVIIGGSFGSIHSEAIRMAESIEHLDGCIIPHAVSDNDNGSAGACYDRDDNIVLFGGWNTAEETVMDTVRGINIRANETWRSRNSLPEGRCFSTASSTIQGDVILVGGGSSPYRGAEVYSSNFICRYGTDEWAQSSLSDMQCRRCGHSAVTLFNDSVLVSGGYSGGADYLSSAELLDTGTGQWTGVPSMSVARSGMACVLGPMGSVYVAGGSSDGTLSHASLERYDPREGGRWHVLAPMHRQRGYTSGCVGSNQTLYVSGGCSNLVFTGGAEVYDFRANQWTELTALYPEPVPPGAGAGGEMEQEERFDIYESLQRVGHQMLYVL